VILHPICHRGIIISVLLLQQQHACVIDRKFIFLSTCQVKTRTSNYCRSCSVVVYFLLFSALFCFVLLLFVLFCFVLFYPHSSVWFCLFFVLFCFFLVTHSWQPPLTLLFQMRIPRPKPLFSAPCKNGNRVLAWSLWDEQPRKTTLRFSKEAGNIIFCENGHKYTKVTGWRGAVVSGTMGKVARNLGTLRECQGVKTVMQSFFSLA